MLLDTDRSHAPTSKKYLERILPMSNAPTSAKVIQLHPAAPTLTLTPLLKPVSPSGQFNPRSDIKSNGLPKAKEVQPFHSFEDFALFHAYLSKTNIRDASLLTIGIATGLRISDLISLKIGHLIQSDANGNPTFKETIDLYEKKTGKGTKGMDDCVYITEAVRDAATRLINHYASKGKFLSLDDWLFQSRQPQRHQIQRTPQSKRSTALPLV